MTFFGSALAEVPVSVTGATRDSPSPASPSRHPPSSLSVTWPRKRTLPAPCVFARSCAGVEGGTSSAMRGSTPEESLGFFEGSASARGGSRRQRPRPETREQPPLSERQRLARERRVLASMERDPFGERQKDVGKAVRERYVGLETQDDLWRGRPVLPRPRLAPLFVPGTVPDGPAAAVLPRTPHRSAVIRCIRGPFEGRFFYLNKGKKGDIFGGRRDRREVTMYIEHAGLSPAHAQLFEETGDSDRPREDSLALRDLNSATGTWARLSPLDRLAEASPACLLASLQSTCRRKRKITQDCGQAVEPESASPASCPSAASASVSIPAFPFSSLFLSLRASATSSIPSPASLPRPASASTPRSPFPLGSRNLAREGLEDWRHSATGQSSRSGKFPADVSPWDTRDRREIGAEREASGREGPGTGGRAVGECGDSVETRKGSAKAHGATSSGPREKPSVEGDCCASPAGRVPWSASSEACPSHFLPALCQRGKSEAEAVRHEEQKSGDEEEVTYEDLLKWKLACRTLPQYLPLEIKSRSLLVFDDASGALLGQVSWTGALLLPSSLSSFPVQPLPPSSTHSVTPSCPSESSPIPTFCPSPGSSASSYSAFLSPLPPRPFDMRREERADAARKPQSLSRGSATASTGALFSGRTKANLSLQASSPQRPSVGKGNSFSAASLVSAGAGTKREKRRDSDNKRRREETTECVSSDDPNTKGDEGVMAGSRDCAGKPASYSSKTRTFREGCLLSARADEMNTENARDARVSDKTGILLQVRVELSREHEETQETNECGVSGARIPLLPLTADAENTQRLLETLVPHAVSAGSRKGAQSVDLDPLFPGVGPVSSGRRSAPPTSLGENGGEKGAEEDGEERALCKNRKAHTKEEQEEVNEQTEGCGAAGNAKRNAGRTGSLERVACPESSVPLLSSVSLSDVAVQHESLTRRPPPFQQLPSSRLCRVQLQGVETDPLGRSPARFSSDPLSPSTSSASAEPNGASSRALLCSRVAPPTRGTRDFLLSSLSLSASSASCPLSSAPSWSSSDLPVASRSRARLPPFPPIYEEPKNREEATLRELATAHLRLAETKGPRPPQKSGDGTGSEAATREGEETKRGRAQKGDQEGGVRKMAEVGEDAGEERSDEGQERTESSVIDGIHRVRTSADEKKEEKTEEEEKTEKKESEASDAMCTHADKLFAPESGTQRHRRPVSLHTSLLWKSGIASCPPSSLLSGRETNGVRVDGLSTREQKVKVLTGLGSSRPASFRGQERRREELSSPFPSHSSPCSSSLFRLPASSSSRLGSTAHCVSFPFPADASSFLLSFVGMRQAQAAGEPGSRVEADGQNVHSQSLPAPAAPVSSRGGDAERGGDREEGDKDARGERQTAEQHEAGDLDKRETGDLDQRETGDLDQRETGDLDKRETGDLDQRETGDLDQRETGDLDQRETGDLDKRETGDLDQREAGDLDQREADQEKEGPSSSAAGGASPAAVAKGGERREEHESRQMVHVTWHGSPPASLISEQRGKKEAAERKNCESEPAGNEGTCRGETRRSCHPCSASSPSSPSAVSCSPAVLPPLSGSSVGSVLWPEGRRGDRERRPEHDESPERRQSTEETERRECGRTEHGGVRNSMEARIDIGPGREASERSPVSLACGASVSFSASRAALSPFPAVSSAPRRSSSPASVPSRLVALSRPGPAFSFLRSSPAALPLPEPVGRERGKDGSREGGRAIAGRDSERDKEDGEADSGSEEGQTVLKSAGVEAGLGEAEASGASNATNKRGKGFVMRRDGTKSGRACACLSSSLGTENIGEVGPEDKDRVSSVVYPFFSRLRKTGWTPLRRFVSSPFSSSPSLSPASLDASPLPALQSPLRRSAFPRFLVSPALLSTSASGSASSSSPRASLASEENGKKEKRRLLSSLQDRRDDEKRRKRASGRDEAEEKAGEEETPNGGEDGETQEQRGREERRQSRGEAGREQSSREESGEEAMKNSETCAGSVSGEVSKTHVERNLPEEGDPEEHGRDNEDAERERTLARSEEQTDHEVEERNRACTDEEDGTIPSEMLNLYEDGRIGSSGRGARPRSVHARDLYSVLPSSLAFLPTSPFPSAVSLSSLPRSSPLHGCNGVSLGVLGETFRLGGDGQGGDCRLPSLGGACTRRSRPTADGPSAPESESSHQREEATRGTHWRQEAGKGAYESEDPREADAGVGRSGHSRTEDKGQGVSSLHLEALWRDTDVAEEGREERNADATFVGTHLCRTGLIERERRTHADATPVPRVLGRFSSPQASEGLDTATFAASSRPSRLPSCSFSAFVSSSSGCMRSARDDQADECRRRGAGRGDGEGATKPGFFASSRRPTLEFLADEAGTDARQVTAKDEKRESDTDREETAGEDGDSEENAACASTGDTEFLCHPPVGISVPAFQVARRRTAGKGECHREGRREGTEEARGAEAKRCGDNRQIREATEDAETRRSEDESADLEKGQPCQQRQDTNNGQKQGKEVDSGNRGAGGEDGEEFQKGEEERPISAEAGDERRGLPESSTSSLQSPLPPTVDSRLQDGCELSLFAASPSSSSSSSPPSSSSCVPFSSFHLALSLRLDSFPAPSQSLQTQTEDSGEDRAIKVLATRAEETRKRDTSEEGDAGKGDETALREFTHRSPSEAPLQSEGACGGVVAAGAQSELAGLGPPVKPRGSFAGDPRLHRVEPGPGSGGRSPRLSSAISNRQQRANSVCSDDDSRLTAEGLGKFAADQKRRPAPGRSIHGGRSSSGVSHDRHACAGGDSDIATGVGAKTDVRHQNAEARSPSAHKGGEARSGQAVNEASNPFSSRLLESTQESRAPKADLEVDSSFVHSTLSTTLPKAFCSATFRALCSPSGLRSPIRRLGKRRSIGGALIRPIPSPAGKTDRGGTAAAAESQRKLAENEGKSGKTEDTPCRSSSPSYSTPRCLGGGGCRRLADGRRALSSTRREVSSDFRSVFKKRNVANEAFSAPSLAAAKDGAQQPSLPCWELQKKQRSGDSSPAGPGRAPVVGGAGLAQSATAVGRDGTRAMSPGPAARAAGGKTENKNDDFASFLFGEEDDAVVLYKAMQHLLRHPRQDRPVIFVPVAASGLTLSARPPVGPEFSIGSPAGVAALPAHAPSPFSSSLSLASVVDPSGAPREGELHASLLAGTREDVLFEEATPTWQSESLPVQPRLAPSPLLSAAASSALSPSASPLSSSRSAASLSSSRSAGTTSPSLSPPSPFLSKSPPSPFFPPSCMSPPASCSPVSARSACVPPPPACLSSLGGSNPPPREGVLVLFLDGTFQLASTARGSPGVVPKTFRAAESFVSLHPAAPLSLRPDATFRLGSLDLAFLRFNVGCKSERGLRPTMEDEEIVIQDLGVSDAFSCSFFGVYDGHGGRDCAEFVKRHLHLAFRHQLENLCGRLDLSPRLNFHIFRALYFAFLLTDAAYLRRQRNGSRSAHVSALHGGNSGLETSQAVTGAPRSLSTPRHAPGAAEPNATPTPHLFLNPAAVRPRIASSGCASVVVVVVGGAVWCANCGDARAVLSRAGRALDLSSDHKPHRKDEGKRILQAGGFIRGKRVLGRLAVSRAFGDLEYKGSLYEEEEVTPRAAQATAQCQATGRRTRANFCGDEEGDTREDERARKPAGAPEESGAADAPVFFQAAGKRIYLGSKHGQHFCSGIPPAPHAPFFLREQEQAASQPEEDAARKSAEAKALPRDKRERQKFFRKPLVIAAPEIRRVGLSPSDEFLLLACDGLFDVFTSDEAVAFIRSRLSTMPPYEQDPQRVVAELVREAIHERKSRDNVTAILVVFSPNVGRGTP
ncbi:putative protein phosphatase 2C [Neospora caninum Liverpool]|uniref:Uncharacterized protein n=1 Tax=Neospora caninum (strain Liverpool) TaxID=572307 RepID=F0VI53_NEOCL|nr:putative protein phosphatase 2C [Neospora caninum Liverpool]CBZ53414.1 putative protein phosphatase 2C [Neospora caninum Liverpool]|eukprot:XP_003883446.1 putative protein phosphatase 2C [Neospora caninum Liverpool]